MELKDIFARMGKGEVAAHSELGTRDEAKQTKNFVARIQKMKTTVGINAHALVMKDVVLPFNPFTAEADDMYNAKKPFRPILLVSQTIEGIKTAVAKVLAENPEAGTELVNRWNRLLGTELNWTAPVTMDDYNAFKKADFIKPRIMSYATVALNFAGRNGFSEFKQKYTVDPTQLNESNSYDPDKAPVWHQGAVFFNAMLKPEADAKVAALEKSGANKEQIAAEKRGVYSKSPIGFVTPTNLIPFLFFPMDALPPAMDAKKPTDFEKCLRFYSYNSDKWATSMEACMTDPTFDEDMDFFDFTIKTPSATATKSNGQVYTDQDSMELYTAMQIQNTDGRKSVWTGSTTVDSVTHKNDEAYKDVWEAAKAYFLYSQEQSALKDGDSFERLMAMSNKFRPIDSVLDKLLPASYEVFTDQFADTAYFTDNIKKANAAFFTAMNPANAMALADVDDDELDEAASAQAASISGLIADATGETAGVALEDLQIAED